MVLLIIIIAHCSLIKIHLSFQADDGAVMIF